MRVCIVICYQGNGSKLLETAKGLSKGILSQGHQVDIIDGTKEQGKKVSFYDYIAMGTTATTSFGGKIPDSVKNFLAQCGSVSGKRSFAFINGGGIRKNKTLKALMDTMEHEGMYLKFSEILQQSQDAEQIGKRLHIGK